MLVSLLFLLLTLYIVNVVSVYYDFETDLKAIPDDESSYDIAVNNGNIMNNTLQNLLQPGDTLFIPNKTFYISGGIYGSNLNGIKIIIDGTLKFSDDRDTWPTHSDGSVLECIYIENLENSIITSSNKGTLDGNGLKWWGAIKFLKHGENRPRLLHIVNPTNVLIENILLLNSPYWTLYAENSNNVEIRYVDVSARITDLPGHSLIDLQAFNTDGFDVTGRNVYIHHSNIYNQDDCISVKDDSQHMLFEYISCSGLGLVIGSIGDSIVQNITFRHSVLPKTVKGIYMKSRWYDSGPQDTALIADILYENITIIEPQQYAIWIGPAQQTGQPCSLLWGIDPWSQCNISGCMTWRNIILKDVLIINPEQTPGVLMGNDTNPMNNVIFDNVKVIGNNIGDYPWGVDYFCEYINGKSINSSPKPLCF
jgi:hypothetical protein